MPGAEIIIHRTLAFDTDSGMWAITWACGGRILAQTRFLTREAAVRFLHQGER